MQTSWAKAKTDGPPPEPDAELRERIELRGKASLGRYLKAALRGGLVQGAEAELMEAAGIEDGIPLELWDTAPEAETRDITGAPGTVGVNLDKIRPHVFAPSVLPAPRDRNAKGHVRHLRLRDDFHGHDGGRRGEVGGQPRPRRPPSR